MDKAKVEAENFSSSTSAQPSRRFTIVEIQSATNNFDEELVIGQGGFGKVYKGQIYIEESSHFVAIKRLDSMSSQGAAEFKAEIEMLSKLRHCNLVSLIGYCDDKREMILVYMYMPRGTLYDHLHKVTAIPLSWIQRLKIAIGAARGLDYLHTGFGTQHGVIHRDVKSSNILLDENWAAMISDFGLSKIGPIDQESNNISVSVKGTFGYLDPEYFYTSKLTRKTDVYAFGVVLFELLSGKLAVDRCLKEEQGSLARWAQKCVKERKFDQLVDSNIIGTIAPKCLRGFAEISYRCLHRVVDKRPTMTRIVAKLQDLLELQVKVTEYSAESSGIAGFTRKIHRYLVSSTNQNSDQGDSSSSSKSDENYSNMVKMFTYAELESTTENFTNITHYNFGEEENAYKGWVNHRTRSPCHSNTGLPIAIKKIDHTEFDLMKILKVVPHPNHVKLIGYCYKAKQLFLVYEFMRNGNFEDLLHSGAVARLSLVTKVKIVVGIARGIVFWNKTQHQVSKEKGLRALATSDYRFDRRNILLDEDFTAKLSCYQLTKFVHNYKHKFRCETLGGVAYGPDDPRCGDFLQKIGLEAFTVVFTEVVMGKQLSDEDSIEKIDDMLHNSGKEPLCHIANFCFDNCSEVDSESRMLRILEKWEMRIPT